MIIEKSIYKHAISTPNKIAVIMGVETVTYSELWDRISKTAVYYKQRGLRKGDRIVLSANKEINFLYCYFGAHLAGLICVPIDTETNPVRLKRIVDISEPKLMVGTLRNKDNYQMIPFDKVISDIEYEGDFPSDEEIADLLFTTGTTGLPKGVGLSFKNQWTAAIQINEYIGNNDNDVELLALPISHSFGLGRIRCIMQKGGTIVLIPSFASMKKLYGEMERCQCTGFAMVPASWAYIRKMSGDKIGKFASQLKYIEIGSAFMPIEEKLKLMELLPQTHICMHYGLTEASRSAFLSFHDDEIKLETIGKASPGVEIEVFDENGNVRETGMIGEICVKGDHVCSCYWGQSERVFKEDFYEGYFRTGDCGSIDSDGFITLNSRIKELINVGGKKVSPMEVEEELNKLDGVIESACVGVPDPIYGEVVKAFIVGNLTNNDNDKIKTQLTTLIENYKVPVYIEHIAELPKTHNGKIQRLLLKK